MKTLNYYETEEVTVCPYCMDQKSRNGIGCCGESSDHFETAYVTQDETFLKSEVTLVYPLIDVLRYEIFNRLAMSQRVKRLKRNLRTKLERLYENGKILKLRQVTGFQWTALDRLVLRQLHDFPLYHKSPSQHATDRKASVKMIREMWAKNGGIKSVNLVPPIQDNE